MRKLLKRTCLFLAPVVAILLGTQWLYSSGWNRNAMLEFKSQILLENRKTKKIILIGGSNCRYSYSSEILNTNFPQYQVINAAIAAPYGLRFHLDYIKPYLKPGDVVLLSPEYELLTTKNGLYGDETLISIAESYPNFYSWILSDTNHAIHFFSHSFRHFIKLVNRLTEEERTFGQRMNDIVKNHHNFGEVILYPEVNRFSNYKIIVDELPKLASQELKTTADDFDRVGVRLIVNFPPVEGSRFIQRISDTIYVNFLKRMLPTVEFLNAPSESEYQRDLFYDSPYHLNSRGKVKHSRIVSKNLAKVLFTDK